MDEEDNQWCRSWCKRTPKSFDLLKISENSGTDILTPSNENV